MNSAVAGEVMFWTRCGFAYHSPNISDDFLEEIYAFMTDKNIPRRFLLMSDSEKVEKYFKAQKDVVLESRYVFEYAGNSEIIEMHIPDRFEIKEIDENLLAEISGSIVPTLFWSGVQEFLSKGKGYCIVHNNEVASWAFSAAVSSHEIDIGIETNPKYQKQGLGMIVAQKMMQFTIEQGRKPVWACHYQNAASAKMAEKLGYVKTCECTIIKRKG